MKTTFASATLAWMFLQSTTPGFADSHVPPVALAVSSNLPVAAGMALTPEEAEQALKRLSRKLPDVGTWRRTTVEFAPDPPDTNGPAWLSNSNVTYGWPTSTNVVYGRLSDGRRFTRKEVTERDLSGKSEIRLYVRNDNEGFWALLRGAAIYYPEKAGKKIENSSKALYDHITGERIKDGERVRLRIVQWITDEEFREQSKKAKKQLPFFLRPFFSTSFIERSFAQIMPCRVETILDEETGNLIFRGQYRKDGKPLEVEEGWSPVPDLPAEDYAVPEGLKQLRPKTIDAAGKLERKIRAEEAQAAKKQSTRKDPSNVGTNSVTK